MFLVFSENMGTIQLHSGCVFVVKGAHHISQWLCVSLYFSPLCVFPCVETLWVCLLWSKVHISQWLGAKASLKSFVGEQTLVSRARPLHQTQSLASASPPTSESALPPASEPGSVLISVSVSAYCSSSWHFHCPKAYPSLFLWVSCQSVSVRRRKVSSTKAALLQEPVLSLVPRLTGMGLGTWLGSTKLPPSFNNNSVLTTR